MMGIIWLSVDTVASIGILLAGVKIKELNSFSLKSMEDKINNLSFLSFFYYDRFEPEANG